jgi:foldase protein PrsA
MVGTAGALVLAVIGLQFLRPEPAASQTREPAQQTAGTARVGASPLPQAGEPLARVNNQNITWEVVAAECMETHAEEVLENLINRQLIHQECQANGIEVTGDDITREVGEIARKFNVPVETWYQLLQNERKITPKQYHRDVIWPMLALKKLAGANVEITEAEVQRAFTRDYGPRADVRMIMIDGNVRQAAMVWEKVKAKPEDFARIASEYSADPNSKALGGQVPPIRRYGSVPNTPEAKVEEQAFQMQPGEISSVIEIGSNKYVIMRCEKQTEPIVTDISVVRKELMERLQEEKMQEAVGQVFAGIKAKAQIHNFLTGESTAGTAGGVIQQTGGDRPGAAPARPPAGPQRTPPSTR